MATAMVYQAHGLFIDKPSILINKCIVVVVHIGHQGDLVAVSVTSAPKWSFVVERIQAASLVELEHLVEEDIEEVVASCIQGQCFCRGTTVAYSRMDSWICVQRMVALVALKGCWSRRSLLEEMDHLKRHERPTAFPLFLESGS
ncbi:hypothetical protein C8J56DRAFT_1026512 [Mycena floridula]|nr:hypothetical protein C8J56DRAFT_1026512 [Mycena floridula]